MNINEAIEHATSQGDKFSGFGGPSQKALVALLPILDKLPRDELGNVIAPEHKVSDYVYDGGDVIASRQAAEATDAMTIVSTSLKRTAELRNELKRAIELMKGGTK